ncbi:MAG: transglutaminase family protein [Xanthobacteraceae bacterium]|nr:transglutaminase family protein [Xanthobacteraceae bacterium]MBX3522436.1 transglutaminase family protein [Xanthobacteraceae bacterium]MBX3535046.1 transglutaminase family protein [Xanthobacteraceae bacterium]MBX3548620.1 transglutaminase family protein [Xanthobacteraceae bacterium]MCW5673829.1 transglutaminase family protein [Xanthobacteraceae bacterium]
MQIKIGFDIVYECTQPTPMVLMLNVHPSRQADLEMPDTLQFSPAVPARSYRDAFGNTCTRIVAPAGELRIFTDTVINDAGTPEPIVPEAKQHNIADLPDEALMFLLASRYCETDKLVGMAWALFGNTPEGWPRVQAICDFVNSKISFGYPHASATRTAADALSDQRGVCRDFAHLAITLCRCMNIPARYCTGYLGDIGVPLDPAPMDFSAWFEVYLGGKWYSFDARHNMPRIARILIGRGRDAADVAISTTFGHNILRKFTVWTDELPGPDGSKAPVVQPPSPNSFGLPLSL